MDPHNSPLRTGLPSEENVVIRVRDLVVQFGDKKIMNGLNLDVMRGEILGVERQRLLELLHRLTEEPFTRRLVGVAALEEVLRRPASRKLHERFPLDVAPND